MRPSLQKCSRKWSMFSTSGGRSTGSFFVSCFPIDNTDRVKNRETREERDDNQDTHKPARKCWWTHAHTARWTPERTACKSCGTASGEWGCQPQKESRRIDFCLRYTIGQLSAIPYAQHKHSKIFSCLSWWRERQASDYRWTSALGREQRGSKCKGRSRSCRSWNLGYNETQLEEQALRKHKQDRHANLHIFDSGSCRPTFSVYSASRPRNVSSFTYSKTSIWRRSVRNGNITNRTCT